MGTFLLSLAFICSFPLLSFILDGAYLARLVIKAIPIDPKNHPASPGEIPRRDEKSVHGLFSCGILSGNRGLRDFLACSGSRARCCFSVMILFCSFIPMIGCAMIWAPLGLSVLITTGPAAGIAFLVLKAPFS